VWKATIEALYWAAYLHRSYWEGCLMKTISMVGTGLLVACSGLIGCEQEADVAEEVSFANDVLPILEANCVECHDIAAEGVAASGLNLSDYGGVMQGTPLFRKAVNQVPCTWWLLTSRIHKSRCPRVIATIWRQKAALH
jgi:hypothetical protein